MSLKDELNAIKDVHEYEEKFKSNEYLTAIAKTWIENWVEEVLTIIESEFKRKVKEGEYEKCGDHNSVHQDIKLYPDQFSAVNEYLKEEREFGIFGVLDSDNFTANKEFIDYLHESFARTISNNGIEIRSGGAKLYYDEYGGKKTSYGCRDGICLYLSEGRGINYISRRVEKEIPNNCISNSNSFLNFLKPKPKKNQKRDIVIVTT